MWLEALVSFLVVVVSTSLIWFLQRKRAFSLFRRHGIPGPEPSLFWGNFMQLKEDRVQVMERWISEYGSVFGYYNGLEPFMVLSDPEMVKQCLVKEHSIFYDRPPFSISVEPFTSSLLELEGPEWKRVRSVLNPTFSSAKMKQMSPILHGCVNSMMDVMKEQCQAGEPVNMFKTAQGFSLDVITKCAFAWQVDCQKNPNDPLLLRVRTFFEGAETSMVRNAIRFPVLKYVFGLLYRLSDYYKVINQMIHNLCQIIELRRQGQKPPCNDLLQLMVEAQAGAGDVQSASARGDTRLIEDRHVVSNAFIFLAAGFETTATSLGFLAYVLATHPDEQQRLYDEMVAAFGDEEPSYEGLQSLKRLDMVIQETLRLYPPVVLFISRRCQKDTTIMGQFFPAGVNIMIPTWHLHHDPALWPEPFEFRPERFDPECGGGTPQHPAAYLPFGLGPRICIGKRFAQLELKMAVWSILREYRLLRCEQTQVPLKLTVPSIIINPGQGIFVKLERRQDKPSADSLADGTNMNRETAAA